MSNTENVIQLRDPISHRKWLQLDNHGHVHFNGTNGRQLTVGADDVLFYMPISAPYVHLPGGFNENYKFTSGATLSVDKNGVLVSKDCKGVIRRYALSDEPISLEEVNEDVKSPDEMIKELDSKTNNKIKVLTVCVSKLEQTIANINRDVINAKSVGDENKGAVAVATVNASNAVRTATNALAEADKASKQAYESIGALSDIGKIVVAVQAKAGEAKSVAEEAKSVAEEAKLTAEDSKTVADEAKSVANDAKTVANDAKTVADDAKTVANDAKTTADDAKTTAEDSKSVANDAKTTAEDSKSVANDAKTTAEEAKLTANDAKSKLTSAECALEKSVVLAKPAKASPIDDKDTNDWFDKVKDKIIDLTSDEDTQAREQIKDLQELVKGLGEHVQTLVDDDSVSEIKNGLLSLQKSFTESIGTISSNTQTITDNEKASHADKTDLISMIKTVDANLNDIITKAIADVHELTQRTKKIEEDSVEKSLSNATETVHMDTRYEEVTSQLCTLQESVSALKEQKSIDELYDEISKDLGLIKESVIGLSEQKDVDAINGKVTILEHAVKSLKEMEESVNMHSALGIRQSTQLNEINQRSLDAVKQCDEILHKIKTIVSDVANEAHAREMIRQDIVSLQTALTATNDHINSVEKSIDNMKETVLTKSLTLCDDLLITDGLSLSTDDKGRLVSKDDSKNSKYYVSSELFKAGDKICAGDVVGLNSNGDLEKIAGGLWLNEVSYNQPNTVVASEWDSYNIDWDVHLYISERTEDDKSRLFLTAGASAKNQNNIDCDTELMLCESDAKKTKHNYISSIVKINNLPRRYVIAYSDRDNTCDVKLVKLELTISKTGETSINEVQKPVLYVPTSVWETYELSYNIASDLDMLVLVGYSGSVNNLECAMFGVNHSGNSEIQIGYSQASISTDSVVADGSKTLQLLTIPGDILICSYGNFKTFIILPASYDTSFNIGEGYIDVDSSECVSMIYDVVNTNIISVERTLSDTAYLRVFDITSRIKPIRTKKLGNLSMIPIGLSYSDALDQFVLMYVDSSYKGQLGALLFSHDGENINVGLAYKRKNKEFMYQPITRGDSPVPINNRRVFARGNSLHTVEFSADDDRIYSISFDDSYGIQAGAFIGMAEECCDVDSVIRVALKGRIFTSSEKMPSQYVGRKLYMNAGHMDKDFPDNITTKASENVFLGTCLSCDKIMIGL